MFEFEGFGKISRLSRDCVVTEKLDGTNAQVFITPVNPTGHAMKEFEEKGWRIIKNGDFYYAVIPGSRNKWLSTKKDNYGFANWVNANAEDLLSLGHGRHFGEWWGQGIQRKYGLQEKRFSLFNVHRWGDDGIRPKCCHVVPTLYTGPFDTQAINLALFRLENKGSQASPDFMNPEGIVIFHTASGQLFKKTIEDDGVPKSTLEEK